MQGCRYSIQIMNLIHIITYQWVITDIPEIQAGTWIDKDIDICSETSDFQREFIAYCQYQVNKTLFPF